MAVIQAADVSVYQSFRGVSCNTGFTFLSDKVTGLTFAEINTLGASLVTNLMARLNAVQSDEVYTSHIHIQARGTTVPANDFVVDSYGSVAVPAASLLPPEFNYWVRWFTSETYESITGDADLAHPIKRGGAFIVGASDEYLGGGLFSVPVGAAAAWADLFAYMTNPITLGAVTWSGAVLGEEIVPGTGWRIAIINGGVIKRITRLRSRLT